MSMPSYGRLGKRGHFSSFVASPRKGNDSDFCLRADQHLSLPFESVAPTNILSLPFQSVAY